MLWKRWVQRANIKGHKVLRLEWDCDKDSLQFDLKMTSNNCLQIVPNKTHHIECACTIRLVRIVSPITVVIKALFQKLCTQKVCWDDEINESQRERWDTWIKDLAKVKIISFQRYLHCNIQENVFCLLFAWVLLIC